MENSNVFDLCVIDIGWSIKATISKNKYFNKMYTKKWPAFQDFQHTYKCID